MKKTFILALIFSLGILSYATAYEAHVTYTAPSNPSFITGVFVSEISGDYSSCYGQLSGPGETVVVIGNIKPLTTYYFKARRYNPDDWAYSNWSDEVEKITPANVMPITHELPPIVLESVELNITVTVN